MTTIQFKPYTVADRDQNIFLTSSPGANRFKKAIYTAKPTDESVSIAPDIRQVQSLRKNIIDIILQFKSLSKPIQLSHQFNQILYSLDTHLMEKKSVGNILSSLQAETNVIKLTRLYNRMKGFGRALERVKVEDESQKTLKKAFSAQGLRKHNHNPSRSHLLLLNLTSQTLPSKQTKQSNELKQRIINQISYRQRLQRIHSQSKRHSLNKQKLMKKKLQRVKQMNKRANQVYERNKRLYKQRINRHRYQQLFDPGQVRGYVQRRGEVMNGGCYRLQQQECTQNSQIEIASEEFITEPKSGGRIAGNEMYNGIVNSSQGVNEERGNVAVKRSMKQKVSALMSFAEIPNSSNVKVLKSLENLNYKQQQSNQKSPANNQSKLTKYPNAHLPKSYSLDRTLKARNLSSVNSKRQQHKLRLVRQKKRQIEQQKHLKMITQAVQKQKRIIGISKKRALDAKTKKSPSDETPSDRSFTNTSNNMFRHGINQQRSDLEDKEREILSKLQSKQEKKELFLQQRVNKVRERLEQQEETREKYRQYVNEYVYLTEAAEVFKGSNQSPIKKRAAKRQPSQQQSIIKCAYRRKMKQSEGRLQEKRLLNLSLTDLKKKLVKIQNEEVKSFNHNFMV